MTHPHALPLNRELLVGVLDRLVPPGDGFPGAGEIASMYVERVIAQTGDAFPLLVAAFEEIDRIATRSGGAGFMALSDGDQDAVLREVETAKPDLFDVLVTHAYAGYYSHPTIIGLLGLDPRPPQPRGHVLEPFDERLLDRVRQRPPMYRMP